MIHYSTPLDAHSFILNDVLDVSQQFAELGFDGIDEDLIVALIDGAGKVLEKSFLPLSMLGDRQGVSLKDGRITAPTGFAAAYQEMVENGLYGLSFPTEHGGHGLPIVLSKAIAEMRNSTCMAIGGYADLSEGAYYPLIEHGTHDMHKLYAQKLASGEWSAAMHLTEPQAGSDLSGIRTRAEPAENDTYRLYGTKIFISCADHDMRDNVVNLVLARLPDAPEGMRGLSLFSVSNRLVDAQGNLGERNTLGYSGIEEKMGLHGSVTGTMVYNGCIGHLVGNPHEGLNCMFSMINETRLGVGLQGVGIAEAALQSATAYANERVQGRAPGANSRVTISNHIDIQRMLLRIRSFTEGARHLVFWTALQLDIAGNHKDSDIAAAARDKASLLSGVIKAHCTDEGAICADTALQVFGGYGYIVEEGIEQYFRDVRVTRIYEGTNNIIAQDFARRRIWINDGQTLFDLCDMVLSTTSETQGQSPLSDSVQDAANRLSEIIQSMLSAKKNDAALLTSIATDLLTLTAHTFIGWSILKMLANAGHRQEDKLTLAQYYSSWRMPEAMASANRILREISKDARVE